VRDVKMAILAVSIGAGFVAYLQTPAKTGPKANLAAGKELDWRILMIRIRQVVRCSLAFLCLVSVALLVGVQPATGQEDATFIGTVVSSSRSTLTVQGSDGRIQFFTFAPEVRKPQTIAVGSEVRVTSSATDEPNVRSASEITVLPTSSVGPGAAQTPVIPPEVRHIERDIERSARRYQVGVRAGVALDPELILIGLNVQVGPIFSRDVYFRPNVEFGIGEVTALFAVNPEVIYRLPLSSRQGRWSTYVGIGPGFNFIHQNFERGTGSSRIDFGQFHSDVGLNILGGIRYRSGMFTEIKTSVYTQSSPTFRLSIGYNF
jgi:hypothetical protein